MTGMDAEKTSPSKSISEVTNDASGDARMKLGLKESRLMNPIRNGQCKPNYIRLPETSRVARGTQVRPVSCELRHWFTSAQLAFTINETTNASKNLIGRWKILKNQEKNDSPLLLGRRRKKSIHSLKPGSCWKPDFHGSSSSFQS